MRKHGPHLGKIPRMPGKIVIDLWEAASALILCKTSNQLGSPEVESDGSTKRSPVSALWRAGRQRSRPGRARKAQPRRVHPARQKSRTAFPTAPIAKHGGSIKVPSVNLLWYDVKNFRSILIKKLLFTRVSFSRRRPSSLELTDGAATAARLRGKSPAREEG